VIRAPDAVTLFLCGDVMTGRGIDQILPHACPPQLHESYLDSALEYVALAEQANGPIVRPVEFSYVWGDALAELERVAPDARIVNLETAVTRSEDWLPKGINYRMHPDNIACLKAAGIDCCVLANNHVLDWGQSGLEETLETLHAAGLHTAGAGRDREQAHAPAVLEVPGKGRVIVFAFGCESSGIPPDWAARAGRPGVALLADLSVQTVQHIAERVAAVKRPRDIAVASIHWGRNWGYAIPAEQTRFAHALIDTAGVDIVHGHSSHHVKGIEVYRGRPILYGCGDLLTDYEGISGYEAYRGDLGLMYFVTVSLATGLLVRLAMTPTRLQRLRITRASVAEAHWLAEVVRRESARFRTDVVLQDDHRLRALGR
jgi:poly-gamma-glutamate capsule biosynthesis protein CapA/YwtB (metallophosphatase superfamily)